MLASIKPDRLRIRYVDDRLLCLRVTMLFFTLLDIRQLIQSIDVCTANAAAYLSFLRRISDADITVRRVKERFYAGDISSIPRSCDFHA